MGDGNRGHRLGFEQHSGGSEKVQRPAAGGLQSQAESWATPPSAAQSSGDIRAPRQTGPQASTSPESTRATCRHVFSRERAGRTGKAGTAQGSEEEDIAGGGVRKKQNVDRFFQKFAYDLKLPPLGHRGN